jgi:hypothetical protein
MSTFCTSFSTFTGFGYSAHSSSRCLAMQRRPCCSGSSHSDRVRLSSPRTKEQSGSLELATACSEYYGCYPTATTASAGQWARERLFYSLDGFFCIATTVTHAYSVGNVAHGAGAIFGILTGYSITTPNRRLLANAGIAFLTLLGMCGATLGRPLVNLSGRAGYDEAKMGLRRAESEGRLKATAAIGSNLV